MGVPQVDNSHVQEGLNLLTGAYSDQSATPNIRGLVTTLMRRVQTIENTLWDVIDSQLLAENPTGQALNQLGDLVGETRGAFSDTQYLLFIKVAIRARRSAGCTEDLLQVCALALGMNRFELTEFYPARVSIYTPGIATDLYAQPLAQALGLARPPGVFCEVTYWDTPNYTLPVWSLSDSVTNTGGVALADQVSGAFLSVTPSSVRF
jgi:hypothetical protein